MWARVFTEGRRGHWIPCSLSFRWSRATYLSPQHYFNDWVIFPAPFLFLFSNLCVCAFSQRETHMCRSECSYRGQRSWLQIMVLCLLSFLTPPTPPHPLSTSSSSLLTVYLRLVLDSGDSVSPPSPSIGVLGLQTHSTVSGLIWVLAIWN